MMALYILQTNSIFTVTLLTLSSVLIGCITLPATNPADILGINSTEKSKTID